MDERIQLKELPEKLRLAADVMQAQITIGVSQEMEIDRLRWLIANGEKHFGTLWRDATAADIDSVRKAHSAGVKAP